MVVANSGAGVDLHQLERPCTTRTIFRNAFQILIVKATYCTIRLSESTAYVSALKGMLIIAPLLINIYICTPVCALICTMENNI